MKPNQRGRFNNRFNNFNNNNNGNSGMIRSSSRPQTILRNTSLESTGPCGKLRGTALQLHEKYLIAAKDAQIQNDDVLAETCFQYADHYLHVQNQAIANEQAIHAQQIINRMPPTEPTADGTIPSTEAAAATATPDESLQVVEVSVPIMPVSAPNADNVPPAPVINKPVGEPKPQRRILRPRMNQKPKSQPHPAASTPRQDFFPVPIEE